MKEQYGFHVDISKCTGCKTCQVACKALQESPAGVSYRRVCENAGGAWQQNPDSSWNHNVFAYYVSLSCNHCDKPACVAACPTTAMHKGENGLVSVDHTKCVGCRYCEWACPYGAPQYNAELGQMTKCDGCPDRVAQGQQPLCVASCPLRALDFGPIADLRAKYGTSAAVSPLPVASLTEPNLVITPSRHTRPVNSPDCYIVNKKEL